MKAFFLRLYVICKKGYSWYMEHEDEIKPLIEKGKDALDKLMDKK